MSFAEDHALLASRCVCCGAPKAFSSFKRKRGVYIYVGLILCTYGTHCSRRCARSSGCCVCETFLMCKHRLDFSFLCMSTNTKSRECDGYVFIFIGSCLCASVCVDVRRKSHLIIRYSYNGRFVLFNKTQYRV